MSMQRSDLPNVSSLSRMQQRRATDAMWRAFWKGEPSLVPDALRTEVCPLSYVATMAEMLEAALVETAQ